MALDTNLSGKGSGIHVIWYSYSHHGTEIWGHWPLLRQDPGSVPNSSQAVQEEWSSSPYTSTRLPQALSKVC